MKGLRYEGARLGQSAKVAMASRDVLHTHRAAVLALVGTPSMASTNILVGSIMARCV